MLGARLHPVGGGAEGGDIEVALEDLLLVELLLQGQGVLDLAQLAGGGPLRGGGDGRRVVLLQARLDEHVAHVLLGEGRGPLGTAVGVGDHGADDARRVDALVLVEALVLHGHDGVLDVDGDGVQRDDDPVLRVELGDLGAVRRLDAGDLARLEGVEVVGQLVEEVLGGARDGGGDADEGHGEARRQDPPHSGQEQEDEEHRDGLCRRERTAARARGGPRGGLLRHGVRVRVPATSALWATTLRAWKSARRDGRESPSEPTAPPASGAGRGGSGDVGAGRRRGALDRLPRCVRPPGRRGAPCPADTPGR